MDFTKFTPEEREKFAIRWGALFDKAWFARKNKRAAYNRPYDDEGSEHHCASCARKARVEWERFNHV